MTTGPVNLGGGSQHSGGGSSTHGHNSPISTTHNYAQIVPVWVRVLVPAIGLLTAGFYMTRAYLESRATSHLLDVTGSMVQRIDELSQQGAVRNDPEVKKLVDNLKDLVAQQALDAKHVYETRGDTFVRAPDITVRQDEGGHLGGNLVNFAVSSGNGDHVTVNIGDEKEVKIKSGSYTTFQARNGDTCKLVYIGWASYIYRFQVRCDKQSH